MHRVCWFCQKNSENEESNIIKDVPEILERESATGTTGDTFETVKYVECDIVIPRCKSCETYHDEREQIPLEVWRNKRARSSKRTERIL